MRVTVRAPSWLQVMPTLAPSVTEGQSGQFSTPDHEAWHAGLPTHVTLTRMFFPQSHSAFPRPSALVKLAVKLPAEIPTVFVAMPAAHRMLTVT
ncbi:MAG TPA: hypothetical protein VHG28_14095 [Longimicrobiaceae bacterium]|nr:hypothetical protein [Longimicrobiaceae bacterium]